MLLPDLPANERERLLRLARLSVLDTRAEAVFDGLAAMAARLTGMPTALLSFVDKRRQWVKAAVGAPVGLEIPREVSFCAHAILNGEVFEVEDARSDPRFADNPGVRGRPGIVHYAGAPLTLPGGERVGVLCVAGRQPGRLEDWQREVLTGLAAQAVEVLLLRESELELRREQGLSGAGMLEAFAPVGMFWTDATGRVVSANRQFASMLGLPAVSDGLGTRWTQALHPQDLAELLSGWREAVAAGRSCEGTLRLRPTPGQPQRWLRLRAEPHSTGDGTAYVGAMLDVTDTMQLKSELVERNRLLSSVIENLPCGLTVFDSQLQHVVSNRKLQQMLDLPEDVFAEPHTNFRDLARRMAERGEYGPGDVQTLAEARVAAALQDPPLVHERRRANGTVLQIAGVRMPDGGLVTTYTDVTGEREAAAALRTSQQRLGRALEASRMGLWEYDLRKRQVYLSESFSRLLDQPAAERVLAVRDCAGLIPGIERATLLAQRRALVQGAASHLTLEHRLVLPAGPMVWVQTSCQVTERDARGRALKIVGMCKHIDEQRRADEALHAALAAADEASHAKSEFLATMSHEIRTPINGVIGLTQLLSNARLPARETSYVTMIASCAKSLLSLVDNILDFSKIEAGRMAVEDAPTQLHELVHELGDLFTVRAAEKDLRFEAHVDSDVPEWILADAGRLRQILLNLLGNALKFTSTGGFSLSVQARPGPDGPQLACAVRDSGIGIAPADQVPLFTRFTQADGSRTRRHQGTGLGLAISRELAQLMGGDIQLESVPGEGSVFTLWLPLRSVEAPAAVPRETPAPARSSRASILLVEDNGVNQIVAQGLLAALGYTDVSLAVNGREAVDAHEHRMFDLILMDCQMPVMDGIEAARALRSRGVATPIVALTASAVAGDRERCLAAGMDDYLTKPIEPARLAEKVALWLSAGKDGGAHGAIVPGRAPVECPAFDTSALSDRFFGDASLFQRCREIFLRQTGPVLQEMEAAHAQGDRDRLRKLAHSTKGSAATVGASRVADGCRRIEAACMAQGPEPQIPVWLAAVREALQQFRQDSDAAFAPEPALP